MWQANGKRPDAVVQLAGGRALVVDSKAPQPPDKLLETGDAALRQAYTEMLKRHIADLGAKRYHADVPASLPCTWLLLPGEGYLQAAYDADGVDVHRIHPYASARGVVLVGPGGLRGALQMWQARQSEQEARRQQEEDGVQEHLQSIQRRWEDSVLPKSRAMGKGLSKVVAHYNEVAELVRKFDTVLRHDTVLKLAKVRKTSLPPTVDGPSEPPASAPASESEACKVQDSITEDVRLRASINDER